MSAMNGDSLRLLLQSDMFSASCLASLATASSTALSRAGDGKPLTSLLALEVNSSVCGPWPWHRLTAGFPSMDFEPSIKPGLWTGSILFPMSQGAGAAGVLLLHLLRWMCGFVLYSINTVYYIDWFPYAKLTFHSWDKIPLGHIILFI